MGFLDDFMGKTAEKASNAAAADQYKKQLEAAGLTRQAGDSYLQAMLAQSGRYTPFISTGTAANDLYSKFLGLSGADAQRGAYDNYVASPQVDWLMDQGTRAIDNSAASRSMLKSGATLKALDRFGQGTAMSGLDAYLNRLASQGGQGFNATQASVGTASQGYGGKLNTDTAAAGQMFGAAPTVGQGMVAGATARGQGAQNAVNLGVDLLGKFMGSGGGGFGSSFGSAGGGALPGGGSGAPWGATFQHGQWIPTV